MTVTKLVRPALAVLILGLVTACAASSVPKGSASTTTASRAAVTHRAADHEPVAAVMPDVIGGNAGRAYEQMNSTMDLVFKDASGQGRLVGTPAAWKICNSQPGPNQQITDSPVVLDVVKTSETCADSMAK